MISGVLGNFAGGVQETLGVQNGDFIEATFPNFLLVCLMASVDDVAELGEDAFQYAFQLEVHIIDTEVSVEIFEGCVD